MDPLPEDEQFYDALEEDQDCFVDAENGSKPAPLGCAAGAEDGELSGIEAEPAIAAEPLAEPPAASSAVGDLAPSTPTHYDLPAFDRGPAVSGLAVGSLEPLGPDTNLVASPELQAVPLSVGYEEMERACAGVSSRRLESEKAHDGGEPEATTSGRLCAEDFPAHRAVFDGNAALATALLRAMAQEERLAQDAQGNTVLHLAVLRRNLPLVEELLDLGLPVSALSSGRWTPLDQAIALKDRRLVTALHAREAADVKAELKAKKGELLRSLRDMPDASFQLKWELGSPVLGMILRKYAPHDTYEVWKRGTKMRVDGTLMGIDEKRTSLIPQWKRGHFSLLFDGQTTPSTMLLCDHRKKTYINLAKEKKRHKPKAEDEAEVIIAEGAGKTKLRSQEFRFKPVKTWLGGDATERIEGWKTRLFEAAGKMVAVTTRLEPLKIPKHATFEEYCALPAPENEVSEVPIDPYSMDGSSPGKASALADDGEDEGSRKKKKAKQARRLSAKCWMAEDFPMSLSQLLPVLDVVGNANKHLARVGKFLQKYGDMALFPVKLQVPLIYTVYALVSFRKFHVVPLSEPQEAGFYDLPSGYRLKTFDEISAKRSHRSTPSLDESKLSEEELQDAEVLKQMGF